MRKVLFFGALLIGGYLILHNRQSVVSDVSTAGTASVNLVHAFQGR